MPSHAVFAEQHSQSLVAAALQEHHEDRDTLLASLTESLRADPRIRAAWMWGSIGRGEADDLSDLDPWLIVSNGSVTEMGASLRQYALQTGTFIAGGEIPQNAPPGGGFFSSLHEGRHGLLHLDCYWQSESAVKSVPERAVLFDRLQEPYAALPQGTVPQESKALIRANALTGDQDRIVGGIGFAWMMLSIAAKKLARDPESDMELMMYPRPGLEDAASLLAKEGLIGPEDWSVPEGARDKVELLRVVANKTARLTEAAISRGLAISPLNAICLNRYLDMVENIVT